jgi:hemolysin D
MRLRPWLFNPMSLLRTRYRITVDQMEEDLNSSALSLPPPAIWTKRLTQVILIGVTIGAGWSIFARVDVVVTARGKLEPMSQSQAVQSQVGGVVTAVHVEEVAARSAG